MNVILAAAILLQTFTGLSLDQAQTAAIGRSPDVAVANGKVAEAQALFNAARASYGPALLGSYVEGPQGGNNGETIAQRLTTVGAQITLGDLIAYSPAVAQANASLRAAQFDFANAQRTERINVISLYYTALTARATLQARHVALQGAQGDLRAAQLRYRNGAVPRLDQVRASVAVAQAQADLAKAQADADNADAALATETGMQAAMLHTSSVPAADPPPVTTTPDAAVQLAVTNRPEVASARANVAMEEHAVSVARHGGLPLVTMSAGMTSGVDTGVNVHGPSLNVNATLPVGGAAHDRVIAEEARLSQAQAQLAKAQRQITTEVGAAVRSYQAQTVALSAAERALAQADAAFKATQVGYRSGASSSLDIESARATYVQALVAQISALYAQQQAEATLRLLIGSNNA
jgi:outer membrane protein TolC